MDQNDLQILNLCIKKIKFFKIWNFQTIFYERLKLKKSIKNKIFGIIKKLRQINF